MARHLTKAQREALDWLRQRGGKGFWSLRHYTVEIMGELAPFHVQVWRDLESTGLLAIERRKSELSSRVTLTALGRQPLPPGADYIIGSAGRADIYDTATGEILAEGITQARQGAPAR